ncbi:MAG: serine/threonine-protein kinase [Myxococcota bacterium]
MSASIEPSAPSTGDPLRRAAPQGDDVEARRARAAIASRLFSGPRQPVRVGRYRVEGRIGAGGMGVVYRAHDPELARDVAVKLMHPSTTSTKDPATARARVVREARAMARLAHPNVIHVYDVGTVEDGVFIAMEFVEGRSLAHWLTEEKPAWREILRRYVEAGRGLAAAHAAGVIHRDFKPENVLVGADGRVRVGDFGLAGGPAALDSASEESELDRDTGDLQGPSGTLTQTGTLLGTPKYMAPEQESGAVANARSDQFSFCVALYEALYGYPPFAGNSIGEYRKSVRHGRVLDPPSESKVRAWVHAEVVRGLAIDPADRHPGLEPLLDRLEEALIDPNVARRRRRRARVTAMTMGALALLSLGGMGLWIAGNDDSAVTEASDAASLVAQSRPPADPSAAAAPAALAPTKALTPAELEPEPEPAPEATSAADAVAAPEPDAAGATDGVASEDEGTTASPDVGTKAPKRKRKTEICYFRQDRFNFLHHQRRHERFVETKKGQCYECAQQAPEYRRAGLQPGDGLRPSDCSRYYLCVSTTEDQCES